MRTTSTQTNRIIFSFLLAFLATAVTAQRMNPKKNLPVKDMHAGPANNFDTTTAPPPPPEETFSVTLFYTGADSIRNYLDNVVTLYDNSFSAGVDSDDQPDDPIPTENIAIIRDSSLLFLERRPVIGVTDTSFLFLQNMNQQQYEMEFSGSNFSNPMLVAVLIDSYTGTRTCLSVSCTTSIFFTVTADPASSAPGRFKLVFGLPGTLAINGFSVHAFQRTVANVKGIQVVWDSQTETSMDHYELERSADGSNFNRLAMQAAKGNSSQPTQYSWFDASPLPAINFYRVKAVGWDGMIKYSSIVRVSMAKGTGGINIYPDPVTGNELNLQLNDLARGTYMIRIINDAGQLLFSYQLQHGGGSATQNITLPNNLPTGIYHLQLSGTGVNLSKELIRIGK